MDRFSSRIGLPAPPVVTRFDAPSTLRHAVLDIAYEAGIHASPGMEGLVQRVLRRRPPRRNAWRDWIRESLDACPWYLVYDLVEAIADYLLHTRDEWMWDHETNHALFERELNSFLVREGIGWKLRGAELVMRGDEPFEQALAGAAETLRGTGRSTASREISEALRDLSRRPEPDVTGSIQHAIAAVECVMRDIAGSPGKTTLRGLLKGHPGIVAPPIDTALEKLWGYANGHGRHLREGRDPGFEEAVLCAHVAAATCTHLGAKLPRS